MQTWWKNLSVSKKLYTVVGVMAVLIATELFTLLFAMNTLSSIRSFVGGESLWSKGQKNAIYSLHRFVLDGDPSYLAQFRQHLQVPLGDRAARLELSKPNPDLDVVRKGFLQGQIHPQDIPGLIQTILRYHRFYYIHHAIEIWTKADGLLAELVTEAEKLPPLLKDRQKNAAEITKILARIDVQNDSLTVLQNEFSHTLGEGSRYVEKNLMMLLIIAVLLIESTGLLLTFSFSNNLSRTLSEINKATEEVGKGNLEKTLPVRSKDELGQLSGSINKMMFDLKNHIGQRKQAENANEIKNLFIASVSHEIRTPLGVILGFTEILKDPSLSETERLKFITTIEKTGKNLSRIIDDILDISKIEAGHLEIEKKAFLLRDFLNDLHLEMKIKAECSGSKLIFMTSKTSPQEVFTDRSRVKQILVNLINNSCKFTKNGTITLKCMPQKSSIRFEIIDNGIGISQEQQKSLFQPFSQVGAPTDSERNDGTGLGLVLSKKLAQALGGDLELLQSELGSGSSFVFTFENEHHLATDTAIPDQKPISSTINLQNNPLQNRKVLVVEDVPENQTLIQMYLSAWNMNIDFAENGEIGLHKALADHYDFILMDMQMPVMDGYTATSKLRERGYHKPIIALTAHAMKEDRARCLRAGCSEYLTKPIKVSSLYSVMVDQLKDVSPRV